MALPLHASTKISGGIWKCTCSTECMCSSLQAIAQRAGVQLSPALRQAAPGRENRAAAAPPHQAEAGMSAAELFRRAQNAGGTLAAVSAARGQQHPLLMPLHAVCWPFARDARAGRGFAGASSAC